MTNKEAVDLMMIATILARRATNASSYRIASNVAKLKRLGSEAHTWAERLCNYGEPTEGADERKRASIRKRAIFAVSEIENGLERGATIEVAGDPRGSCLKVTIHGTACQFLF